MHKIDASKPMLMKPIDSEAYDFLAGMFSDAMYTNQKINFEELYNGVSGMGYQLINSINEDMLNFDDSLDQEMSILGICQDYSEMLSANMNTLNSAGLIDDHTLSLTT